MRNIHPEFVDIPEPIERQAARVVRFEQWVADGNCQAFHDNHYDWWAFPIDKPSSYAFAYTVYSDEIAQDVRFRALEISSMSVVTSNVINVADVQKGQSVMDVLASKE
jgi:hypothetical protein